MIEFEVIELELLMAGNRLNIFRKIFVQQVLLDDYSVFSIQWMLFPGSCIEKLYPDELLSRYLHFVRRCTLSIIRPLRNNRCIEFRILNTGLSLISFNNPSFDLCGDSKTVTLPICGGLLVQTGKNAQGKLSFIVRPAGKGFKVILKLTDFCPRLLGKGRPSRLRKTVYRLTQAHIHKMITVKFLAKLYSDLEGVSPCINIVRAGMKKGEET
jgi:hypothetical protein